jgi:F-type H+-transporting ATPase subunit a
MSAGHNDPFHHVRDSHVFEVPAFLGGEWALPVIHLPGYDLQLTKFMVLQVAAGLITLLIFRSLARQIEGGKPASGGWANFWEVIALYIRDNVVRPTLAPHDHHDGDHHEAGHADDGGHGGGHGPAAVAHGAHPGDRYLPFIWTCFFYILFCNLLGAVPWLGSPTGNLNVTGMLAVMAFGCTYVAGVRELGATGFWKNLIPPLDAPGWMKPPLTVMMFVIEVIGLFIKHGVLAIRLFANIMGGHTVIGVMLGFIAMMAHSGLWYLVAPASVLGQVGIGLLELFVAFLQAYVFAFLATIFIAMGSHPH